MKNRVFTKKSKKLFLTTTKPVYIESNRKHISGSSASDADPRGVTRRSLDTFTRLIHTYNYEACDLLYIFRKSQVTSRHVLTTPTITKACRRVDPPWGIPPERLFDVRWATYRRGASRGMG
jgi:hypothetical protein